MRWWFVAGVGMLYGLAMALVVYLAKGAPATADARYAIPSGIITGMLAGLLILAWRLKTI